MCEENDANKLFETIGVLRFEPGDVLLVKVLKNFSLETIKIFKENLDRVIPKELNIKVLFVGADIEFEVLRKNKEDIVND